LRFGGRSCVAIARAAAVEISWSNRHVHLARASCEITRPISMRRFRPRSFYLGRFVAYKRDLISSHALPYQPVGVSPRSWSAVDSAALRFRKPDASAFRLMRTRFADISRSSTSSERQPPVLVRDSIAGRCVSAINSLRRVATPELLRRYAMLRRVAAQRTVG